VTIGFEVTEGGALVPRVVATGGPLAWALLRMVGNWAGGAAVFERALRTCAGPGCGMLFSGRADELYHSDACRQRA
jgi:hypothetical protein